MCTLVSAPKSKMATICMERNRGIFFTFLLQTHDTTDTGETKVNERSHQHPYQHHRNPRQSSQPSAVVVLVAATTY